MVQIPKYLSIALVTLALLAPLKAGATSAYTQFGGIQALIVSASIDRDGAKLLGRTRSVDISRLAVSHLKQHAIWKKLGIALRDRKFPALPPEIKKTRVLNVSFRISLLKHHDGTLFSVITSAWSRMYDSRGEELHQETLPNEAVSEAQAQSPS